MCVNGNFCILYFLNAQQMLLFVSSKDESIKVDSKFIIYLRIKSKYLANSKLPTNFSLLQELMNFTYPRLLFVQFFKILNHDINCIIIPPIKKCCGLKIVCITIQRLQA